MPNSIFQEFRNTSKKGLRILNFRGPCENNDPFYRIFKIFRLTDLVRINNLQFVQNRLDDFLSKKFLNNFSKTTNQHNCNTKGIRLNVPIVNTTCYGSNSITLKAIRGWNNLQIKLKRNSILQVLSSTKIMK